MSTVNFDHTNIHVQFEKWQWETVAPRKFVAEVTITQVTKFHSGTGRNTTYLHPGTYTVTHYGGNEATWISPACTIDTKDGYVSENPVYLDTPQGIWEGEGWYQWRPATCTWFRISDQDRVQDKNFYRDWMPVARFRKPWG